MKPGKSSSYFNQLGRDVAALLGKDASDDEVAAFILKAVYQDPSHVLIRNCGNSLTAKGMSTLRK